ncbi:MAG: hypothetical protein Q4E83_06940 [bacterium]|nr:hypothetical protein [bacterium]
MFENNHLTMREQFFTKMANQLIRNSDAAYTFMGVVCDTVSITDLPTIEAIFLSKTKEKTPSKN